MSVFLCLVSLRIIPSTAIPVVPQRFPLLWLSSIPLDMRRIFSRLWGHFGCFRILATGDNAAANTEGHVGFELVFLFPSEKYPGGTARSYGNSTFGFLRSPPYSSPRWGTTWHSHQQSPRAPFSPQETELILEVILHEACVGSSS